MAQKEALAQKKAAAEQALQQAAAEPSKEVHTTSAQIFIRLVAPIVPCTCHSSGQVQPSSQSDVQSDELRPTYTAVKVKSRGLGSRGVHALGFALNRHHNSCFVISRRRPTKPTPKRKGPIARATATRPIAPSQVEDGYCPVSHVVTSSLDQPPAHASIGTRPCDELCW